MKFLVHYLKGKVFGRKRTLYSNSRLSCYDNCPQMYKFRYIDRIKMPRERIETFLGSRVHETLEKLYRELLLTKLNSLDDLFSYFNSQWEKNWHKKVIVTRPGFSPEHYKNTGKEAITTYYKHYAPFNQSKTLSTECYVRFKIDKYTIQGYIDRLSHNGKGWYEIHDYKTSGSLPTQDKLDIDRQLGLYQIGITERFKDVKEVKLIWHYLIFDEELISMRSDAQLADLKKEVLSIIKNIENDEKFSPRESGLCDWCEYPEYCPAKKHEAKVEALPPEKYLKDGGVSLVNKYAALKMQIKELKNSEEKIQKELKLVENAAIKYADKNKISAIAGSNFIMRILEDEILHFPNSNDENRVKFEKLLKKVGLWEQVSNLCLSKLLKLVREEDFEKRLLNKLSKFGKRIPEISVKLIKKSKEN